MKKGESTNKKLLDMATVYLLRLSSTTSSARRYVTSNVAAQDATVTILAADSDIPNILKERAMV